MTYFINLRAQSVGGNPVADVTGITVLNISSIDELTNQVRGSSIDELTNQVRGKDVLLATHGFNVNQKDGEDSLVSWERKLTLAGNVVFIGVLWPGDSAWLPVLDYPFEGNEATRSGQILARFLNDQFAEASSLSIVSHSLGARMTLETIRQLNRRVSSLTLMAGAIDDDCLTDEYRDAAGKVDSISVLASHGDEVLKFAFPAGNFLSGILSRGHPYWHAALGREGPANLEQVHLHSGGWQIPDEWGYGHGYYLAQIPGIAMLLPVNLPTNLVTTPRDTSAWSAGFVSTRL